jgi:anti-sigma regulatory factor (Ser/Thr protein kinase)
MARGAIRELIAEEAPNQLLADAILLASELIANSLRHVEHPEGSRIELVINLSVERLRVEVQNDGPGYIWDKGSAPVGHGLSIVDALSDRWGISYGPTRAWFEIGRTS